MSFKSKILVILVLFIIVTFVDSQGGGGRSRSRSRGSRSRKRKHTTCQVCCEQNQPIAYESSIIWVPILFTCAYYLITDQILGKKQYRRAIDLSSAQSFEGVYPDSLEYQGSYFQYDQWHKMPNITLIFKDSEIEGAGTDQIGDYNFQGLVSWNKVDLTKQYLKGTGNQKENKGHMVQVQLGQVQTDNLGYPCLIGNYFVSNNSTTGVWYIRPQSMNFNNRFIESNFDLKVPMINYYLSLVVIVGSLFTIYNWISIDAELAHFQSNCYSYIAPYPSIFAIIWLILYYYFVIIKAAINSDKLLNYTIQLNQFNFLRGFANFNFLALMSYAWTSIDSLLFISQNQTKYIDGGCLKEILLPFQQKDESCMDSVTSYFMNFHEADNLCESKFDKLYSYFMIQQFIYMILVLCFFGFSYLGYLNLKFKQGHNMKKEPQNEDERKSLLHNVQKIK